MLKVYMLVLAAITSISMASAGEPAKNPTKKSGTTVRTLKRKRSTTTIKKKPTPPKPANDDNIEGGEEGDFSNCR